MKGFGLAAVLALAVVASACSSGSTPSSSGGSPPPSPTASQSTDSGGSGGATSATVQAGAGGFIFSPNTVTIAEGGVITVKNVGTVHHTFTIQNHGIDQLVNRGDSAKVTIDLAPGTYTFVCRFHQSQGMTGTLTVTG